MMAASKTEDYQLFGEVLDEDLKELGYSREDLSVELFASNNQARHRKRTERTGSREAGGPQSKKHTAPRPRAPGAGNQRKPKTTGAPAGKRK